MKGGVFTLDAPPFAYHVNGHYEVCSDDREKNEMIKCICPICSMSSSSEFFSLSFRKKDFLPDRVSFMYCDNCNFVFTSPRDKDEYIKYYAVCRNDQLSEELNLEHYNIQKEILSQHVDLSRGISVLDLGCGCGGLLNALRGEYPQNTYVGYDPNLEQLSGIECFHELSQLSGKRFELIICSHVMEHLIDPYFFDFSSLLADGGTVYIEVPDPFQYKNIPRNEFLYYLDRIHVNHFSKKSLCKLFERYSMHCVEFGDCHFTYKDGMPYPASYTLFSKNIGGKCIDFYEENLFGCMNEFIIDDGRLRKKFSSQVLIYGFGDNFFRSCQAGGPLEDAEILGVIDRDADALIKTYGDKFVFMDLDTAAMKHSSIPVVVCVSFGSEKIVQMLHDLRFSSVYTI